jgi:diguanylate cyclase (GGDEF)-like protein/PAS domain S-box-containing protein
VLINDITHFRMAERRAKDSENRLLKFFDATQEGIIFHERGIILDCNKAACDLVGREYEDLVGTSIFQHIVRDFHELVLDATATGREEAYEVEIYHSDGSSFPVELTGRSQIINGQPHRMTVVRDVRARRSAEARIQFLANHDELTGLSNRRFLRERMQFVLATSRRQQWMIAGLFIDLDNMKQINDELGHAAGDAVLVELASRLKASVRETDLVARIGGDEFFVVLVDVTDSVSAVKLADDILTKVQAPFEFSGNALSIRASIGVALSPTHANQPDQLINAADTAMYDAKAQGKGRVSLFELR